MSRLSAECVDAYLSSLVDRRLFGLADVSNVSTSPSGEWKFVVKRRLNQAHCWVLRDQLVRVGFLDRIFLRTVRSSLWGWFGRRGVDMWDRSYFENFTVDASIFVVTTSY